MTDPRDGRKYKTVKIGNKVWMAENLRNGDISHYSANNYRGNDKMYGYLYTWENAKKACPSGWRLPTKNEFYQLLKAIRRPKEFPYGFLRLFLFIKKKRAQKENLGHAMS